MNAVVNFDISHAQWPMYLSRVLYLEHQAVPRAAKAPKFCRWGLASVEYGLQYYTPI